MKDNPRIIGIRSGSKPGPLLILLAQIHGNEPAGYKAVKEVFEKIDEELFEKPHFDFRGNIVAIHGNMEAAKHQERYLHQDLNRIWQKENVERILGSPEEKLRNSEEIQLKEIMAAVQTSIEQFEAKKVILLDLHTTTAHGGMFIIPSKDEKSRQLGLQIHAPVLHGFLDDLDGTILHYFRQKNFPQIDLTSICFEAGQHDSPNSIEHAVSAIIQCFTAAGGFFKEDIEMKHQMLLTQDSQGLPKEAQLIYCHHIEIGDHFRMREDKIYRNFDFVTKGEVLASDRYGSVRALCDGRILMPLYQKQGNDGFFIIKDINQTAPRLHRRIPETTLNA